MKKSLLLRALQKTGSSLCLTFSLESFVDFLSSVAVLWRFFAPSSVDAAIEEKLHRREKRASMGISLVLILLGIVVFISAISDYAQKEDDPENLSAVAGIAFCSIVVFGVLAAFKFQYANVLESISLYKDGLCSLIGVILSCTLFISSLLIQQHPGIWWIDPTVAMFCGFGAIFLGSLHVRQARQKEHLPIFTLEWWFTSQGSKDTGSEHGGTEMAASTTPGAEDGDLV